MPKSFAPLSAALCLAAVALLSGCAGDQPLKIVRSLCPAAAVIQNAGDITLFSPADSRDADAIDVTASITDLRSTCNDTGDHVTSSVSFDVIAQRRQLSGARDVILPYFSAVIRAGDKLVAKQTGQVVLHFADGQARAQAAATARGDVLRAAAVLPEAINTKLTRKRKETDFDAGVDPMSDPAIRDAVRAASFELLIGFQLTEDQLAYNIAK